MTEAVSTRRIFFALWPSEERQRALAQATASFLDAVEGRPTPRENLHLTLVFLGSVPEDAVSRVRAVAEDVSNAIRVDGKPIDLTLDRIDYWRKPQILCATATHISKTAVELAEHLKRELIDVGFAPDLKAFRAHVTFARKVMRAPAQLNATPVALTFRDFSLVESRTASAGSVYSVIDSWPLCAR